VRKRTCGAPLKKGALLFKMRGGCDIEPYMELQRLRRFHRPRARPGGAARRCLKKTPYITPPPPPPLEKTSALPNKEPNLGQNRSEIVGLQTPQNQIHRSGSKEEIISLSSLDGFRVCAVVCALELS
jgi:hypothetical protein